MLLKNLNISSVKQDKFVKKKKHSVEKETDIAQFALKML